MSMPQQGPPDPQTPGPVSGGPQSPYESQGAPPPYQPSPPQQQQPPSYSPSAGATARPAALMLGGIATAVVAFLFLLRAVAVFLDTGDYGPGPIEVSLVYAAYYVAIALVGAAAAFLAMAGNDFGRIFAAAVAGAAMWEAAGWWQSIIVPLVTGHGLEFDRFSWFPGIVAILGGFVGIGAVVALATPAISTYSADKRRKPGAGGPPMGAPPSGGPGMAPPPGTNQQQGTMYGGQPQQGQQYGGQPQQGQQYGGQPQQGQQYGGQPQQGQQYGGQPQQGTTYGGEPPAGPAAPQQSDPGAPPPGHGGPPPAGPQY